MAFPGPFPASEVEERPSIPRPAVLHPGKPPTLKNSTVLTLKQGVCSWRPSPTPLSLNVGLEGGGRGEEGSAFGGGAHSRVKLPEQAFGLGTSKFQIALEFWPRRAPVWRSRLGFPGNPPNPPSHPPPSPTGTLTHLDTEVAPFHAPGEEGGGVGEGEEAGGLSVGASISPDSC